jgi:hypothetical protein
VPKKRLSFLGLIFVSLFCLLSCGLEEFSYIDYIPEGSYKNVNEATVWLPDNNAPGYGIYFSNFIIYYRIYIAPQSAYFDRVETVQNRSDINQALSNDWSSLYRYTDVTSTTVTTSNLETTFNNQKYYKLELEPPNSIDSVLGKGSLGQTLTIIFPTVNAEKPVLRIGGSDYVLRRANSGLNNLFNPEPENRLFQNAPALYDNAKAYSSSNTNPTVNADTVSRVTTEEPPFRTYVSMYIAAAGASNLIAVYSQPTFLGIFSLPESF